MGVSNFNEELIRSEERFSFEIEGEESINAADLSHILENTVEIVNQIVQGNEDTFVNLKVTKFSKGSFVIDFQAIGEQLSNMLTDPGALATYIVAGVTGTFGIAKHLKGKRPKEIIKKDHESEIVNQYDESITINTDTCDKFFENVKIDNSIINIINIVEKNDRDGFSIKSGECTVRYNKSDIIAAKPIVEELIEENEEKLVNEVSVTLIIRKPDLMGKSKWGFIFDNNIEASVEDEEWLTKIREDNFKFGKGMKLPVKMRIETHLDKNGNPKPDPTYTIIKVTGDVIEENNLKQIEMDLD